MDNHRWENRLQYPEAETGKSVSIRPQTTPRPFPVRQRSPTPAVRRRMNPAERMAHPVLFPP